MVRLILNLCYLSVFITCFSQPAWSCFPNYSPERFVPKSVQGPDYAFDFNLNKSFEDITQMHTGEYAFSVKKHILSVPPWELIQVSYDSLGSYLGLYLASENKVKGYCLLEEVQTSDPCINEKELQEKLQGKNLLFHYLNTPIPTGLQLEFYEQVKGTSVERIAMITVPTHPEHDWKSAIPNNRFIVMRSRYPVILEAAVKPWIERYFEVNFPRFQEYYGQTP